MTIPYNVSCVFNGSPLTFTVFEPLRLLFVLAMSGDVISNVTISPCLNMS